MTMRTAILSCTLYLSAGVWQIFVNEFLWMNLWIVFFWFLDVVSVGKLEWETVVGKTAQQHYLSLLCISRVLRFSCSLGSKHTKNTVSKRKEHAHWAKECRHPPPPRHGPLSDDWSWISPCSLTCCGRVFPGFLSVETELVTSEPILEGQVQ